MLLFDLPRNAALCIVALILAGSAALAAEPRKLEGHAGAARAVVYSPNGKLLFTAGEDGKLIFWEASSGKKLREWQLGGAAYALRFSPDSRYLAVGNANGTIYVLRLDK